MIVCIGGSRSITDPEVVERAVAASGFKITRGISGGAPGVDTLAEMYFIENHIPYDIYPADWKKFRKAAGKIRNQQMAEILQAYLSIWDGTSTGTKDMIERVQVLGKPMYIYRAVADRPTKPPVRHGILKRSEE